MAEGTDEPPQGEGNQGAAWLGDPTGRHEYRYWNGSEWTDWVSDTDPPTLTAPVAATSTEATASASPAVEPTPSTPVGPWYRRWWVIAGAAVVLIIVIAAITGRGSSSLSKTSSSEKVAAPDPTAQPPATQPPTTTTAPAGRLFNQSGSGIQSTSPFNVPNTWHINWHYDCFGAGGTGNFIITVYDTDGAPDFDTTDLNQLGRGGDGTQHYFGDAGMKYLKIISECAWTVTALPGSG